ncbi:type I glyceraldehyde-3-phosphate dehydrogenase [Spiroplasma melliferum]|uniref:Glyceraldehyde-3-phosphate dehydrogenase n=2 Tax=Spiroplasma melliferum TaxID=2134 RepID=A0AAI9T2N7_SPIME|nr:type I glyceraldehyde-3-phosphate dehydrogenase [Spiroplasma melliferum]ELL44454.1 glyceraldehyde-3-phosphate dehydrogenase [Spiroplasma melliferum IPMB4A]KAI92383.1 glyceraldehyde-3-phosphate dehydrogenase [Spiroplasma melliferum KC3]QCO23413.1 glyceraldehyde 3-phosphate dehydrogenase [Spiroplasma melliferum]
MTKIAINGFGRIGRLAFRRLFDEKNVEIVAINDLTEAKTLATLLELDSAQGGWKRGKISSEEGVIIVDGKKINVYAKKDPTELPWGKLGIDVVVESTGFFADRAGASKHLTAGAKKVLISAPAKGTDVKTIVYNVNHKEIKKEDTIISGASCTTNCLAPMAKVLDEKFGIEKGYMTTVHAVTNDQRLLDLAHDDLRRARAAFSNIVPTKTGAAAAVALVLPQLEGRFDGMALRVPTITGSIVDLAVELKKTTTVEEINNAMKAAASETFGYNTQPIVSSDIIGETHGSIFDATLTKIIERDGKQLVKVYAWYDNEMSYVSQMVRTLLYFATV